MKRFLTSLSIIAAFACTVAFASAKGPIKDKHQGKTGLEGQAVNCGYCHGKEKANVPKAKVNNMAEIKKSKYCSMDGCH